VLSLVFAPKALFSGMFSQTSSLGLFHSDYR
jgi:hypothetical protein